LQLTTPRVSSEREEEKHGTISGERNFRDTYPDGEFGTDLSGTLSNLQSIMA
jgi:hypothetical protein